MTQFKSSSSGVRMVADDAVTIRTFLPLAKETHL